MNTSKSVENLSAQVISEESSTELSSTQDTHKETQLIGVIERVLTHNCNRLEYENLSIIQHDLESEPQLDARDVMALKTKLSVLSQKIIDPKIKKTLVRAISGAFLASALVSCIPPDPKTPHLTNAQQSVYTSKSEPLEEVTEIYSTEDATAELKNELNLDKDQNPNTIQSPKLELQMWNENIPNEVDPSNEEGFDLHENLKHTYTPPSLMLHSADLKQLDELIPMLNGYTSVTYSELYSSLQHGEIVENPLLVSIDDLGTSWLREDFKEMIQKLSNAGIVGTLGINTIGSRDESKAHIWEYLRELSDAGWELALHSEGHLNLPSLSDTELREQIEENYNEIKMHTGVIPKTLILPFGSIHNPVTGELDKRIFDICNELDIVWVVGISGGKSFGGVEQSPPYYIGRIPPGKDAQTTKLYLQNSFSLDK
jgi:hypothetical protein